MEKRRAMDKRGLYRACTEQRIEIGSQPILGHSFMCGVSLGLAVTWSPSLLCTVPRPSGPPFKNTLYI